MKTPQENIPELAKALGLNEIWFKREDLHHLGSHKGRSIPFMMDYYCHREQKNNFVISSSGNAALAAALYTHHHNANNPEKIINLKVFIGEHIEPKKLERLQKLTDTHISLEKVTNPKQSAFKAEKNDSMWLRQSTDDLALKGYYELAEELDRIPNVQAIFIPTSSGTTAQALAEAFINLEQKPEIHIVQTTTVHPIAKAFQQPLCPTYGQTSKEGKNIEPKNSIANAIVDKIAHRKFNVVDAVLKSAGTGWIITDNDIQTAIQLVKKTSNIEISPNSALSVAGLMLARKNGKKWNGPVVCLITGA